MSSITKSGLTMVVCGPVETDIYTEGLTLLLCRFQTYVIHLLTNTMFLQVSDVKSSCVADLRVDARNNQALVEYKDGSKYLYNNVDFSALYDLIYKETDSLGQWVINSCKSEGVQCIKL